MFCTLDPQNVLSCGVTLESGMWMCGNAEPFVGARRGR